MSCGCKASISDADGRAAIWKEVFGETSFPIVWPLYVANPQFPGKRFLQGDNEALTQQQKVSLSTLMSKKFGIPETEVMRNLGEGPIPILDEQVSVSFRRPHSRLMM